MLSKRALSPAMHVLEDTSYQTRPKIDVGDATLLMGSINHTRLDGQNEDTAAWYGILLPLVLA